MPVMSTFQQLPLLVVEAIIKQYIRQFRIASTKEWLILYDVCYSWRTLALRRFYKRASIVASTAIGEDRLVFPDKPGQIEDIAAPLSSVNEVEITFEDGNRELGDSKLNDFSSAWPESLVFPKAQSLIIYVDGFLEHYKVCKMLEANDFTWIAERIRTSMPNLQYVNITEEMTAEDSEQNARSGCHWDAGSLLSAVLERAARVDFQARPIHPGNIRPFEYNCPKLTQLSFTCVYNVELLHHVARRSAATLEMLSIYVYPFQAIYLLIVDDENHPVVFPRLQKLYFESYTSEGESVSTVKIDNSIAVFPALRHLQWLSDYNFVDDWLFRGNNSTLEYLDISFGNGLVNFLRTRKLFSTSKYPRLSYVRMYGGLRNVHSRSDKELYLKHMARLLSPATQSLTILDAFSYAEINDAVFKTTSLQNIQVLDLYCLEIKFFEMISLIKQLPALTRLKTPYSRPHFELEHGVSYSKAFVEDLYKEYYPLSFRFRHWINGYLRDEELAHIALGSVILTVLCPSFVYTEVPQRLHKRYLPELKAAVDVFSNSQYSETLEHLYQRSLKYFG